MSVLKWRAMQLKKAPAPKERGIEHCPAEIQRRAPA